MEWTKEKPRKEGWYWMRKSGSLLRIEKVFQYFSIKEFYLAIPDRFGEIEIPNGWEWAGPIPEPHE